jgi:hypothetical protein
MQNVCDQHSGIKSEIEALKTSDSNQWLAMNRINEKLEKYSNRMPNWAALLFAGVSAVASSATTYAIYVK